jgi:hypothetical protein
VENRYFGFAPGSAGGGFVTVIRSMTVVGSSSVRICERFDLIGAKLRGPVFSLRARRCFCRRNARRWARRRTAYNATPRARTRERAMTRFMSRKFACLHRSGARAGLRKANSTDRRHATRDGPQPCTAIAAAGGIFPPNGAYLTDWQRPPHGGRVGVQ